jgi:hypothetical protein
MKQYPMSPTFKQRLRRLNAGLEHDPGQEPEFVKRPLAPKEKRRYRSTKPKPLTAYELKLREIEQAERLARERAEVRPPLEVRLAQMKARATIKPPFSGSSETS